MEKSVIHQEDSFFKLYDIFVLWDSNSKIVFLIKAAKQAIFESTYSEIASIWLDFFIIIKTQKYYGKGNYLYSLNNV